MRVFATSTCRFGEQTLPDTCRRYDELIRIGRCPHISKVVADTGLEVYAVVDSNCHHHSGSDELCDKEEANWLRLIAKSDGRSSLPKHVQVRYRSEDPALLSFVGGTEEDERNALARARPITVAPSYSKSGVPGFALDHVEFVQGSSSELQRVAVEISLTAWKGTEGRRHHSKLFLNVAIPPSEMTVEASRSEPTGISASASTRVFLSHSSQDKAFVRKLLADLKAKTKKLEVFFDESELRPADSIVEKISDALRETDYLVVVLSEASVESKWVKAELNAGLARQLSDGGTVVIPVLIAGGQLPELLRDRVYADFRDSYEQGLARLLEVFGQEARPARSIGGSDDDCPSKLRRMRIGDLRRLMRTRLERETIRSIWDVVLDSDMDAEMPKRGITDCLVDLFRRAKNRNKMNELYQEICKERPDIAHPEA